MAISGRGFCPVADRLNPGPGDFMLTRAGSFRPNEDGYLVNAAGHFLQGWPIGQDGTVGIVGRDDFSSLSAVRVAAVPLSGNPTADVTRSEERRVGNECVSTCRSRWSQDHSKKNI